jgi:hypothetical protein
LNEFGLTPHGGVSLEKPPPSVTAMPLMASSNGSPTSPIQPHQQQSPNFARQPSQTTATSTSISSTEVTSVSPIPTSTNINNNGDSSSPPPLARPLTLTTGNGRPLTSSGGRVPTVIITPPSTSAVSPNRTVTSSSTTTSLMSTSAATPIPFLIPDEQCELCGSMMARLCYYSIAVNFCYSSNLFFVVLSYHIIVYHLVML